MVANRGCQPISTTGACRRRDKEALTHFRRGYAHHRLVWTPLDSSLVLKG
jgi:hypothetical protein